MASGYMFSHYWPGDGVQNQAPPTQVYNYHYPWFNHTTVGFLGYGTVDKRALAKKLKGLWLKHIWRNFPTRLIATFLALKLIWSPSFTVADWAIREIAQDPASRDLNTWGELGRAKISNAKEGENLWRNFAARLKLNHPKAGPLTELAWLAWKARGR